MKIKFVILCHLLSAICLSVHAQGTAFTYEGRLQSGTDFANGRYDLAFSLYGINTGGVAIAGPVTNTAVAVTNGLFTTQVDFGNAFNGSSNWLEIAVSTNGANNFSTLTPRQQITPTPYAIYAENAGALTVQQNTNGAPNMIAGSPVNFVASGIVGATIAGGGSTNWGVGVSYTNSVTGNFGTVSGGNGNTASGYLSTVSGGQYNIASGEDAVVAGGVGNNAAYAATVSGGYGNSASGNYAAVSGGLANLASVAYATVSGGEQNTASGYFAAVGGGSQNTASGYFSAVPGGDGNTASGYYSTVPGGNENTASGVSSFAAGQNANAIHDNSFIWSDNANFSSTAIQQFAVHANGGVRLVGNVTAGDLSLSENGPYHNLSMSGGNSTGFLYGSYNFYGDGIHLGYNFYADAAANPHVPHPGAPTSRISVGYGSVALATGPNDTPPTDRLFVDVNGRVGIGRTPTANLLEIAGNASKSTAGSWLANSDARIKTRIATITNALETLDRVRLVSFHYTDDYRATHPEIEDRSYLNVIAQEFARVFPDAVKGSGEKLPDGSEILQVDTYPLTIYSAAAIQELNQKLEAENAELKARLERLERLVNSKNRSDK